MLQAAIAATQDERRFDAAILRTLGASRAQLTAAQIAEFLVLGALAGLLAAAGATAVGYVLADRVFQIPFAANPLVWLYGVGGGALVVTLAGWLGTRGTMRQPPLAVICASSGERRPRHRSRDPLPMRSTAMNETSDAAGAPASRFRTSCSAAKPASARWSSASTT